MFEQIGNAETWMSLLALAALEIVLGIDNIVFIAIMVQRIDESRRDLAYRLGLGGALVTRLLLLLTIAWVIGLTAPLLHLFGHGFSGRDLIMLTGGLFLIFKASQEIFQKIELREEEHSMASRGPGASMAATVGQIMLIDIVFSLDSVITAVGIAKHVWVMAVAMVAAVLVMLVFARSIGDFVTRNPSMQILALSFLLLVGVLLLAEGFGQHVSKGYVYFAMGFSLLVELFNMRRRKRIRSVRGGQGPPPSLSLK